MTMAMTSASGRDQLDDGTPTPKPFRLAILECDTPTDADSKPIPGGYGVILERVIRGGAAYLRGGAGAACVCCGRGGSKDIVSDGGDSSNISNGTDTTDTTDGNGEPPFARSPVLIPDFGSSSGCGGRGYREIVLSRWMVVEEGDESSSTATTTTTTTTTASTTTTTPASYPRLEDVDGLILTGSSKCWNMG